VSWANQPGEGYIGRNLGVKFGFMTTPNRGRVPWLRRNTSVWLVTMIVSASVIRSSDQWTAGGAL